MLARLDVQGNAYLGVQGRASDEVAVVSSSLDAKIQETIGEALEVDLVETTIAGSTIVGSLMAINEHGILVTDFATSDEIERLESTGLPVETTPGVFNAMGNNVLVGPGAALVHPEMAKASREAIESTLDVRVETGTVAGLNTVGAAGVANRHGVLAHPKAASEELDHLERLFGAEVAIGTVNHGAPLVGAGLLANSHGAVVGSDTTGPELNRIENALGYLD